MFMLGICICTPFHRPGTIQNKDHLGGDRCDHLFCRSRQFDVIDTVLTLHGSSLLGQGDICCSILVRFSAVKLIVFVGRFQ